MTDIDPDCDEEWQQQEAERQRREVILDAAKAQLNIIFDDYDNYLLAELVDTAIEYTADWIELPPDPDTGEPVALTWDNAPRPVRRAILMLVAHWYENREATLIGERGEETPFGFLDLISAYRKWVF